MKNCKKIALLLIIFILLSTLNVFAADYATEPTSTNAEVTFTSSSEQPKVGETITITLAAKCETGISGLDSTLEWDKSKLELTNQSELENSTMSGVDASTGEFKLSVFASNETADEVELVKVNFKVLDAATAGETLTVKLSAIELYDNNVDSVEITDKTVTLTVASNETSGDGSNDESGDGSNNEAGDGSNNESGDGSNNESGDGSNNGTGDGSNNETGDGSNSGNGNGSNNGSGNGASNNGSNSQGSENKDNTTADKNINHAGIEDYAFMLIPAAMILAIMFFVKYKKYSDVI